MDEIVDDVCGHFPGLEVTGLPITGRILRLCRFLETRREEQLAQFGLTLADFDMLATLRRQCWTIWVSDQAQRGRLDQKSLAPLLDIAGYG